MARILVIKHGALGDVVLTTGAFAAIREHHKGDHITLLTTAPYVELLKPSGYFDDIWVDRRAKLRHFFSFFSMIKRIRLGHFSRIYDLQTSDRSGWYFRLLGHPRPQWVGTVKGASHCHTGGAGKHTLDRQKEQLALVGITTIPKPSLSWLSVDIARFYLPARYALIIPGGSSHRPGKRWPASHYGDLSAWLSEQGVAPVLIGTQAEMSVLSTIEALCPDALNLIGKTSFAEVAELARHAVFAVGNDTGPMHLVAVAGCPCVVLFSQSSDPALCAPRGNVTVLREPRLADLSPEAVTAQLQKFL